MGPPVALVVRGPVPIYKALKGYTGLTTIYFADPVRGPQRARFDALPGLRLAYGLGASGWRGGGSVGAEGEGGCGGAGVAFLEG